jgi:hypothetical protein
MNGSHVHLWGGPFIRSDPFEDETRILVEKQGYVRGMLMLAIRTLTGSLSVMLPL